MGLVNNYVHVLKNYAGFSGRARRREYWLFLLADIIIGAVFGVFSLLPIIGIAFDVIFSLYASATLLPRLAVRVRRIHDTGHSGLWLFILFGVPCLNWIDYLVCMVVEDKWSIRSERSELFWLLTLIVVPCLEGIVYFIWMAIAGEAKDNRFGPDPKSVA
ncbi:MAG: DUF805 domain-containing protein [Clostridiales bacterium]|jgi:uncharacterized membrane protein YhaH (DUF805 family)|nr:DUF805 domain-containing protein [Clostridiales bacterium]